MTFDEIIKRNFYKISDEYKEFCAKKNSCSSCDIFNAYKTVVQSEGNAQDPTFMIVCECPGQVEVEKRRPLVGRAGQELRKTLRKHHFNRSNTILTNVIPCRPLNNKFPSDWDKVYNCFETFLRKEIEILKPKFIITCGAPALKAIRGFKDNLTSSRGLWLFIDRFKCWSLATWHPSYTLRCQNDNSKLHVPLQFESDFNKVSSEWIYLLNSKETKADPNKFVDMLKNKYKSELEAVLPKEWSTNAIDWNKSKGLWSLPAIDAKSFTATNNDSSYYFSIGEET